jgi:hypothetical protein
VARRTFPNSIPTAISVKRISTTPCTSASTSTGAGTGTGSRRADFHPRLRLRLQLRCHERVRLCRQLLLCCSWRDDDLVDLSLHIMQLGTDLVVRVLGFGGGELGAQTCLLLSYHDLLRRRRERRARGALLLQWRLRLRPHPGIRLQCLCR